MREREERSGKRGRKEERELRGKWPSEQMWKELTRAGCAFPEYQNEPGATTQNSLTLTTTPCLSIETAHIYVLLSFDEHTSTRKHKQ
jgi:hypothetical protein